MKMRDKELNDFFVITSKNDIKRQKQINTIKNGIFIFFGNYLSKIDKLEDLNRSLDDKNKANIVCVDNFLEFYDLEFKQLKFDSDFSEEINFFIYAKKTERSNFLVSNHSIEYHIHYSYLSKIIKNILSCNDIEEDKKVNITLYDCMAAHSNGIYKNSFAFKLTEEILEFGINLNVNANDFSEIKRNENFFIKSFNFFKEKVNLIDDKEVEYKKEKFKFSSTDGSIYIYKDLDLVATYDLEKDEYNQNIIFNM